MWIYVREAVVEYLASVMEMDFLNSPTMQIKMLVGESHVKGLHLEAGIDLRFVKDLLVSRVDVGETIDCCR